MTPTRWFLLGVYLSGVFLFGLVYLFLFCLAGDPREAWKLIVYPLIWPWVVATTLWSIVMSLGS